MNPSSAQCSESAFMQANIPLLLERFDLDYYRENSCIEYFINMRDASHATISSSVVFSYSCLTRDMHISRFHPEIYLQPDSKYLSAACFYLLCHHCAAAFALDNTCHISLETVPSISDGFYLRLRDFNFHVRKYGLGNVVELISDINRLPVDTSMITLHVFGEDETPFLK